ncbi:MAG: helix-hairpin-helix domain-containing protein [Promethearchaeota archaeon]
MKNITSIMQISNSLGKSTTEKMISIGIDSVEKLASANVENLLAINEIGIKTATKYIEFAQKHLERIKAREKIYAIIKDGLTPNVSITEDKLITKKPDYKIYDSKVPIDWIKKLAYSKIEDVSKLEKMGIPDPKRYIEIAKKYLEGMRVNHTAITPTTEQIISGNSSKESGSKSKILDFVKFDTIQPQNKKLVDIIPQQEDLKLEKPQVKYKPTKKLTPKMSVIKKPIQKKYAEIEQKTLDIKEHPILKPFFTNLTMQKIRFLHFKIKKLEKLLERNDNFSITEINNIIDYIAILNVNYKTQSQIKILKELEITPSFYDPLAKREIKIWDLIFECARVLWIAAQAYSFLSGKFEKEKLMENAIVSMVECSKMFKAAAYFSAACTRQEDKGIVLSVDNLELNSEESRIFAQNLATISEEKKENYAMAANLSSGLSALTKRLAFLRKYDKKKENHFKAQFNYDMGRACHLKAKSLLKLSSKDENIGEIEKIQKKANFYYLKAEEIWDLMLNNDLTEHETKTVRTNLSIVNENIIENDVELISEEKALEIQDPEPLIIVPENLAPFIPRTTNFLTQSRQNDLNFDAYLRYKNLMSDVLINFDKLEELHNNKAGIGRTLKQLKILYENNDIDINTFTELFEKYSIKLETIQNAIQRLKNPSKKPKIRDEEKELLKSIM